MKVAVATDDLNTVSPHLGMARHYLVYELEGKAMKGKEVRDKAGHGPGEAHHRHGAEAEPRLHDSMLSNVSDCEAIISGGMGTPMFESIRAAGKAAYITRIRSADEAVKALAAGTIDNHVELLH